jgi:hypothetical protein
MKLLLIFLLNIINYFLSNSSSNSTINVNSNFITLNRVEEENDLIFVNVMGKLGQCLSVILPDGFTNV